MLPTPILSSTRVGPSRRGAKHPERALLRDLGPKLLQFTALGPVIEEFAGPIRDEDYVEGTIELTVGYKPILSREQVDLVDQLWMYLVPGDASRGHPAASGDRVTIRVDKRKSVAEATLTLDELRRAMVPAAAEFFRKLRPFVSRRQATYDRYLARLASLA